MKMEIVKNQTILISMHCHQLHLCIDYNSENTKYLRPNNSIFPSGIKSIFDSILKILYCCKVKVVEIKV